MGDKKRSLGFKKKHNPEQPYSKGIHAVAFGSAASNSAWEVAEISSNLPLNAIKAGCLARSFGIVGMSHKTGFHQMLNFRLAQATLMNPSVT